MTFISSINICTGFVYLCHASAGAVWSGSPQTWHVCSAWAAWRGHHHAGLCPGWRGRSEWNQDARSTCNHGCASWKYPQSVEAEHTHAQTLQATTEDYVCAFMCAGSPYPLKTNAEALEHFLHVATLLHGNDTQVILLIHPDQEGLVLIVPVFKA